MARQRPPRLGEVVHSERKLQHHAAICPHCGTLTTYYPVSDAAAEQVRVPGVNLGRTIAVLTAACRTCNGLIVYAFGCQRQEDEQIVVGALIWPLDSRPDHAPTSVDTNIRTAYDQARAILPLSAMGAAVLARRALQHVIRKKLAIVKSRLFDEIEEAVARDELAQPTRQALHHVREIGNWGAHPNIDQAQTIIEVSREEAEYTLDALEMLFHDLYVAPDRIAAMEARIHGRKLGARSAPDTTGAEGSGRGSSAPPEQMHSE